MAEVFTKPLWLSIVVLSVFSILCFFFFLGLFGVLPLIMYSAVRSHPNILRENFFFFLRKFCADFGTLYILAPSSQGVSSLIYSFSGNPKLWHWTLHFIKITVFCLSSSPCSGKNGLCLQRKSCIHVDLIQCHFFFQGMDSVQFLSIFQPLSSTSKHVKNILLSFFIVVGRIQYRLIQWLCHYLNPEVQNQD